MKPLSIAHDTLFKTFLTDVDIARDFLQAHLPAKILETVDLSTVRIEPGNFVDPDMNQHYSDVLYSMALRKPPPSRQSKRSRRLCVYCLVEHLSNPDPWGALRLLRYSVSAMYENRFKVMIDGKKHHCVPLVVPILFYQGRASPYPYSMHWMDQFLDPELAHDIYTRPFPLVDLTTTLDDEIMQHKRVALLEMVQKHIRDRDVLEITKYIDLLIKLYTYSPDQMRMLIRYLFDKGKIGEPDHLVHVLKTNFPHEEETIMGLATFAEHYTKRGRDEGLQEGLQQGLQQGRDEVRKEKLDIAKNLLLDGIPPARVLKSTGLSEKDIAPFFH